MTKYVDDSVNLEGKTVVVKVDANKRCSIVFVKDDEGETHKYYYKSVLLEDVEFGAGMVRGKLVQAWKYQVPSRLKKRAYFNKNHVPRYVNKYDRHILTTSKIAMTSGSGLSYE